jgi:hypothetical protein
MIDKEFPHLHYCGAAAGAIPAVFFVSPVSEIAFRHSVPAPWRLSGSLATPRSAETAGGVMDSAPL